MKSGVMCPWQSFSKIDSPIFIKRFPPRKNPFQDPNPKTPTPKPPKMSKNKKKIKKNKPGKKYSEQQLVMARGDGLAGHLGCHQSQCR